MNEYALSSLRGKNYASSITDLDGLRKILNNAAIGERCYFSINMSNGTSKVFYTILERGAEGNGFIGKFYRDYEKYPQNGMTGYQDLLIKGFYTADAGLEHIAPELSLTDDSVKTLLVDYVEIFLDAVQVISTMPY